MAEESPSHTSPLSDVEVFRTGTHTDAGGTTVTIDEEALDAIVQGYDADLHEAPVVLGHPADNAPAYGWVSRLARVGNKLIASIDKVAPALRQAVRNGHYRKVSASFYRPESAHNPTKGQWALRHIGLLGDTDTDAVTFTIDTITEEETTSMPDTHNDTTVALAERQATLDTRETVLAQRESDFAEV